MTLSGGEYDLPACGPPASFSVHLAISALTLAGSVHKSRGDNVVRMWMQLKRYRVCECYNPVQTLSQPEILFLDQMNAIKQLMLNMQ